MLGRFCSEDHYEEFRGDLEEIGEYRHQKHGQALGQVLLWIDALSLFRVRFRKTKITDRQTIPIAMLRNYLFVALRNVRRHAAFSLLNIVGLSISMAVGLILILFINQAASQDEFHENADRLVRVYSDFKASFNRSNALYGSSPANLSDLLESDVPGIERAAKMRRGFRGTLVYEGSGLALNGFWADPAFFELFSFELSAGDKATALLNPGSLVLSPSEALKFFGSEDPIGKVMSVADGRDYTVTGVLASDDYDTIIPLSVIASYSTLESDPATLEMLDLWTSSIYSSITFALLEEGADLDVIQQRVSGLIPAHFAERDNNILVDLRVQPVANISLGPMMGNEIGTSVPSVVAWFLASLALMILMTAGFNYVGLTVSRSLQRAKEVGVRKVFGAAKSNILSQFFVETIVVSLISVAIAVLLLQWMVPAFNNFSFVSQTGMLLDINYTSGSLYVIIAGFTLFMALIAGLYPALFLSRFQPAEAMKGSTDLSRSGGSKLRKTLVVVQFSMSLIFLVITVTMIRQANYLQEADYGIETSNVVNVRLFDVPYTRFRDQIRSSSAIEMVSGISLIPAMGSRSDVWVSVPGATDEENVKGYQFAVDENLVQNFGLTMLAGRNLTEEMDFAATNKVLVNEVLLQKLQLGTPEESIGQSFIMGDSTRVEIAGVVQDFQSDDLSEAIAPNIFTYNINGLRWANVRVVAGKEEEGIEAIKAAWKEIGYARQVAFESYESQLQNSFILGILRDMYRLIGFIALLTVIIACLGLVGIASFNVERRTKEISIRKVLGAEVSSILTLLSKEFLWLIGIATVISLPIAYIGSNMWLQTFANRIDFGFGMMLFGLVSITIIALLTIGSQSLRAALANPIDHLHDE
jgi:putative ABC transport system permease protein